MSFSLWLRNEAVVSYDLIVYGPASSASDRAAWQGARDGMGRVSTAAAVNPNQLRNRVASAYFQDERLRVASLVNGASIRESATWCLGAQAEIGDAVPLAVFARSGGATKFLDAWTARRERMETPPRRYWAWRLAMRPWDVFLAQLRQFQCQLHDLLTGKGDGGAGDGGDPCAPKTAAIGRAAELLAQLETWHAKVTEVLTPKRLEGTGIQPFEIAAIKGLKDDLGKLAVPGTAPSDRILVAGGILELPPAGYLPVDASGKLTVNEQVRAFMGPGVDLRYCIVTPDYVPHALEMRQHMDRIPLTDGIDDPSAKPKVDILVPGGRIVEDKLAGGGTAFQLLAKAPGFLDQPVFGAANGARLNDSGGTFTLAGTSAGAKLEKLVKALKGIASAGHAAEPAATAPVSITREHLDLATRIASHAVAASGEHAQPVKPLFSFSGQGEVIAALESSVSIDANPFQLDAPASTRFQLEALLGVKNEGGALARLVAGGTLFATKKGTTPQGVDYVFGSISGSYAVSGTGSNSPGQNVVLRYELLRQVVSGGTSIVRARVATEAAALQKWVAQLPFIGIWYTWNGDPLKGVLKVFRLDANQAPEPAAPGDIPLPPGTQPLFEIDLTQAPAVLDPTEQHHVLAESALQILAAMMSNGADWQKATETALFPRPPAGGGNITVLGERDWVLFARRRLDTCAEEVVTPKAPNRHYHVYVREAKDEKDAEQWVKGILGPKGTPLDGAQFVGLVDFDATTADPVDAAGLRAELDPVKGDALRWAITASDYGDGRSEEARRRGHLEQAVSPVLDVTGASPIDRAALPKAFEGRIDGGQTVHGVVVLVAVAQVAVVSVRGGAWEIGKVVFFKDAPDGKLTVNDPMEFGSVDRFKLLGSVRFRNRNPDPEDLKSVVAEWTKLAAAQKASLAHVVAVTTKGSPTDSDTAARAEARAIAAVAVAPGTQATLWNTHANKAFTDVDALAFLISGPEEQARTLAGKVVLVKLEGVANVKPLLEQGLVNDVLNKLKHFLQPVDGVEFVPGEGVPRRCAAQDVAEGDAQGAT